MKKRDQVPKTEEGFPLRFRVRSATSLSINIPDDVMTLLKKIASRRDMSLEALVKLYVGKGLRKDLTDQISEQALEKQLITETRR